jgi:hypothetical protein
MAKKPKTNLPAVTPKAGVPMTWQDALRQQAAQQRAKLDALPSGGGGQGVSFKRGVLAFGGEVSRDNPAAVVLLDYVPERTWFGSVFDESNPTPPDCYSYDGVAPHPDAHDKQHANCKACPHAMFGSDTRQKGQACKQGTRLALVRARDLEVQGNAAPIFTGRLSVMNAMTFKAFAADAIESSDGLQANVVSLRCEPDDRTQYRVTFKLLEEVPPKLQPAVMALTTEAAKLVIQPYPPMPQRQQRRGASRMAGPRRTAL